MVEPVFAHTAIEKGMYESFYLRAVAPEEPVGAWIRYTVHKRPGHPPQGSLWCTIFDAGGGAPFMHKHTSPLLSVPSDGWIAIDGSNLRADRAVGGCGPASWDLRVTSAQPELRHLAPSWLYRAPLPRTKLTSPAPLAHFDGTIELPDRALQLDGWRGMVGHNWGSEHAERWIWLHGVDFAEDENAWIDLAPGRVLVAGRLTRHFRDGCVGARHGPHYAGTISSPSTWRTRTARKCGWSRAARIAGLEHPPVVVSSSCGHYRMEGWRAGRSARLEHPTAGSSCRARREDRPQHPRRSCDAR